MMYIHTLVPSSPVCAGCAVGLPGKSGWPSAPVGQRARCCPGGWRCFLGLPCMLACWPRRARAVHLPKGLIHPCTIASCSRAAPLPGLLPDSFAVSCVLTRRAHHTKSGGLERPAAPAVFFEHLLDKVAQGGCACMCPCMEACAGSAGVRAVHPAGVEVVVCKGGR